MKWLISLLLLLTIAAVLVACGGGGASTKTTASPATVNVSVSDPATCAAAAPSFGPYAAVYVTITDVQINASATAGDNDSSWIDLTPALKNAPQQIDLLGAANNQCFLATLGSTTALQPGTYQQMRIMLADNSFKVANDSKTCNGVGANCVVLASGPQPLLLSSETKNGIKIPSGQIGGGQFTIAAGETKDLNINFDTCASIVVQGNGQFRLKPVLRAYEVKTTSSSINGKLVDKATNQPIGGGKAIVALEQKDAAGIDRVIMQTTPDASGNFNFCPVPDGTYDLVAVAINGLNSAYQPTITTGVTPGTAVGSVQMNVVGTGSTAVAASTAPASLTGQVTTVNATTAGTGADVSLTALQQVTIGSLQTFTIPVGTQSASVVVTTEKPSTCASSTCAAFSASYTLTVPAANATVGAFAAGGTAYTAGAPGNPTYTIEANAFVPSSGGTADCTPSKITTAAISATAGQTTTVPVIAFVGCQ